MIRADVQIRLGTLAGVNQERTGRLPNELADCLNIIGEGAGGFSVWKGSSRWTKAGLGKTWGIHHNVWPDEHEATLVVGENGVSAIQVGEIYDITGTRTDLSSMEDLRNPVHFCKFDYGNYVIGSFYRREDPFYWDGHIDHDIESVTVPSDIKFRVVESWAGRLWGIGSEQHPLQAFYGDQNALEIEAEQWLSFLDNPKASRLVGMRAASRNTALVWGDRGLWQVSLTGSYPLFVNPQLLDTDCDCVSNNSIVAVPGMGYAWMGREGIWALVGGRVQRIDLSADVRRARRLKSEFDSIPINSQYLSAGFRHRDRNLIVWSYPTKECIEQHEWQSPRSVAYRPGDGTWWLIDKGWQSVTEVVHRNRRLPIGTDPDGYLYLIDQNIDFDKISTALEWYCDFEWQGDPARKIKWLNATLERPFSGTDKVAASFWTKHQATAPVTDYFSLDEAYDDASLKTDLSGTDYDPGGPDDVGISPDPLAQCRVPVRLVGPKIKVELSNLMSDGTRANGPKVPMSSLTLAGKVVA